ncbi:MAG: 3-deoxy-7-phosphoheptulonate synthase [Litorivicinus sp.]
MDRVQLSDINIEGYRSVPSPTELKARLPLTGSLRDFVARSRQSVRDILDGKDSRLIVVTGPCSIHDTQAAIEYAEKLKALNEQVSDQLLIVMRAYFEKPRTTVGWKGLINDPHLDDSFDVETGLEKARNLLIKLTEMGLPLGTEALDPVTPQYLQDTITWSAIGARTTESQTHREMSSGLSSPIGFKNGTDGGLDVAIHAMQACASGHAFLGIDPEGKVAVTQTRGNAYGHVVLRGGGGKPNYDSVSVALAEQKLEQAGLKKNLIIDCSHANSSKDPALQPLVLSNVINQVLEGNTSIKGVMLESHLKFGNQSLKDPKDLEYGVSITDGCIDWATTEKALLEAANALRAR